MRHTIYLYIYVKPVWPMITCLIIAHNGRLCIQKGVLATRLFAISKITVPSCKIKYESVNVCYTGVILGETEVTCYRHPKGLNFQTETR